jgi:hypothetical protein
VSQEDDILIVSEAKPEAGNFDPMRVFVPMITHLLRVAQANMGTATTQSIKFQVTKKKKKRKRKRKRKERKKKKRI